MQENSRTERAGDDTVPTGDSEAATISGVFGRFQIHGALGRGGMGVVLAARDPELGRDVAIKVLRAGRAGQLEREARAMARLSHPNVVAVYEIGQLGDQRFIVMERIDGCTLRAWLGERPRGWRDIVAMFVAAGRGLAAAHAAGLVHRDFKPENVLVGSDGRPRVGDFGLAAHEPDSAGELAGTPAYMSPEQREGAAADAHSDQYSFCVALREALTDAAPPSRIAGALDRGLRARPAERWPSLLPLLDELDQDPAVVRRRIATASVVLALAAIAGWGVLRAASPSDPCARVGDRLRGVWDPARRDATRAHLAQVDPVRGTARLEAAAAVLDRYAARWTALHVDGCRAGRDPAAPVGLYDRRVACLERRRRELARVTDRLAAASKPSEIDDTTAAVRALPDLDACASADALLAALPPPDDPEQQARFRAVEAGIDAVRDARQAGRLEGQIERATDLVARARDLRHAGILAAALHALAELQLAQARQAAAADTLRELTEVAAQARDADLQARAWTSLIGVVAAIHPDQALALIQAGRAAIAWADDRPALRADLLRQEGYVLGRNGRTGDSLARLDEAAKLIGDTDPVLLARILTDTGWARQQSNDQRGAAADFRRALALYEAAYGADHPQLAAASINLGQALKWLGEEDAALHAFQDAVRIRQARLGETPALAAALTAAAFQLQRMHDPSASLPLLERALRIDHASPGVSDADVATAVMALGNALGALHHDSEALTRYDEAIALFARIHGAPSNLPITLYNRAELLRRRGDCAAAVPDYRRALELFTAARGPEHPQTVAALTGIGGCEVALGHFADAIAPLERIAAMALPEQARVDQRLARLALGRALVETGRDRTAGLAMIRAARDELGADRVHAEDLAGDLAAIDAWLARRGRR